MNHEGVTGMIHKLNMDFSEEEKRILYEFEYGGDVDVRLCVRKGRLFYSGLENGEPAKWPIENPRRMIGVGGYYLLETEDELGEWYMGVAESDFTYSFWGNYRDLENALRSL